MLYCIFHIFDIKKRSRDSRLTVVTEVDEDVFTVSTVQETTRFLISGVKDPVTDEVISLEDALSKQIVDQEKGLYRLVYNIWSCLTFYHLF